MDLREFSSGPKAAKQWLNIICNNLTASTVTADNIVGPVSTNEITLVEQSSVSNPPSGSSTIYVNESGVITTQGSTGPSVPYLPITGGQMVGNIDMNANSLLHVLTLSGSTNTRTGDNIVSNAGSGVLNEIPVFSDSSGKILENSGVLISSLATTSELSGYLPLNGSENMTGDLNLGNHKLVNASDIGYANSSNTGDYGVCLGQYANITSDISVAIGFTANTSNQGVGVGGYALATNGGIALGYQSSADIDVNSVSVGNNAISSSSNTITIGNATNSLANSCLIGNTNISTIYANNSTTSLGTLSNPFQNLYLSNGATVNVPLIRFSQYTPITVTNTMVETTIITTGLGTASILANSVVAGSMYKVQILGSYQGTGVDTVTLRCYLNGVLIGSMGLMPNTVSQFQEELSSKCLSSGASGSFISQWSDYMSGSLNSTTSGSIDTTSNMTLNITAQWSAASASDHLTASTISLQRLC